MKCKRCGTAMNRVKKGEHIYSYVCPKCGLTIGGKRKDTHTAGSVDVETHNSEPE